MTQDEIIRMARQADIEVAHMNKPMTDAEVKQAFLECFAKRVLWADSLFQSLIDGERAAEREACAKVCDDKIKRGQVTEYQHRYNYAYEDCAAAIRARNNND